ncbi:hypothetical protein JHW43_004756 [Diplocarpon mali]|nr:hypothetical protein JHW43_004756 [Diplocarpon mali]
MMSTLNGPTELEFIRTLNHAASNLEFGSQIPPLPSPPGHFDIEVMLVDIQDLLIKPHKLHHGGLLFSFTFISSLAMHFADDSAICNSRGTHISIESSITQGLPRLYREMYGSSINLPISSLFDSSKSKTGFDLHSWLNYYHDIGFSIESSILVPLENQRLS